LSPQKHLIPFKLIVNPFKYQKQMSENISEATQTSESLLPEIEEPSFGWTPYAERMNGRFAMLGFVALLVIEVITRQGFLAWLGLL
jgi:hypothetical protein